LEDALRRDLTINALFYNVQSRSVEDFTGKVTQSVAPWYPLTHTQSTQGLDDLRNGLIRTPLAPEDTFRDDPLRLLRAVRFAARFDFTIVPELEHAARLAAAGVRRPC
jgi:tRNA nucleotidyltransferase (CCA-adding enzyme)